MPEANGTEAEITLEELLSANEPEAVTEPEAVPTSEPAEEAPIRPVFEEAKTEETEDSITEEDLDALESEIISVLEQSESEKEAQKAEFEKSVSEYESKISELEAANAQALETAKSKEDELQAVEELWAKVQNVPVLGQLVRDVIEGKEVDIPEMVRKKVEEDAESIPNIEQSSQASIPEPARTLQDVFNSTPTISFN